jgi:CheY-like chemotaxis protein
MDVPAANSEETTARGLAEWRRLESATRRLDRLARSAPARVLVVDDDDATRLLYSINLELEGLVVLEAADGLLGLARARRECPDLVLTDVMMPGLDGFQLAEALRRDERTSRIPVVFVSAETAAANEARARELGALAYLTKPFDACALAGMVAGLFSHAADASAGGAAA